MSNTPRGAEDRELISDYESPDGPVVTHVRGTLLAASLRVVKEANLYDKYLNALPKKYEEELLYSLASTWLPIAIVRAHYDTLDSLNIDDRLIEENAERVGATLAETFLVPMARLAQNSGPAAVWARFRESERIFSRVYRGGACRIWKIGSNEAVVESRGNSLCECRYYRVASVANQRGLSRLFHPDVQVRQVRPFTPDPIALALLISWKS